MAPEEPALSQYPLYDTTFTTLRVSPLYTGSEAPLDNTTLQPYARQLRDVLAGDVLRGVQVGLSEDNTLARLGSVQDVTWKLLPDEELWTGADETQFTGDDTTMSIAATRGMIVTISYETAAYTALLLRDTQSAADSGADDSMIGVGLDGYGFEKFPLLLTKMPAALREPFTTFLSTTFDARVSILHLSSGYITTTLEKYLAYVCIGEDGDPMDALESSRSLRITIGSFTATIGFDIPGGSGALKTIDIQIAREDLPRMISRGKKLGDRDAPFMDALAAYVKAHLALNLKHEMVKVLAIHCEAFQLHTAGKARFSEPRVGVEGDSAQRRATRRLVDGLITAAKGGTMSAAG